MTSGSAASTLLAVTVAGTLPAASAPPVNSHCWYITPEAQTLRDVYAGLKDEFGIVVF